MGNGRRWGVLVALSVAVLTVGIDLTVLNVALPTLVGSLHASTSQLQWFVDSYSLVLAASLLPAGILADRFGRKRLLLLALALFAVSSAGCAYAGTPTVLIATRALLGAAAAVVITVSLSMVAVLFPADEERQKATALIMGCTVLGYPLGPVLGGWLLNHFWWGSVFLVNVPVATAALLAIAVLMPESRASGASRLDGPGVILVSLTLSAGGLVAVTYGVIQAGQEGWGSTSALASIVIGVLALGGFVLWERRPPAHHGAPLIDLRLFRSARFTWGTLLATLISFALFGLLFAMPQYFQGVLGVTPFGSGLRTLPFIGGFVMGALLATVIGGGRSRAGTEPSEARIGTNVLAALGFALMAVGLFLGATTSIDSTTAWASLWFVITGLGLGMALPATMNAALGALSPERAGVGSGLIMACRQVGATVGVAVLGTVLSSVYRGHLHVDGIPERAARLAQEGVGAGQLAAEKLGDAALATSVKSAFVVSLDVMLSICGGIAVIATVLALTFLPRAAGSERARSRRRGPSTLRELPAATLAGPETPLAPSSRGLAVADPVGTRSPGSGSG